MKLLLSQVLLAFLSFTVSAQVNWWTYYEDTTGTLSSPRATDLNGDGVLDVLMGAGAEDKERVSTIAIDGSNGKLLWKATAENEIFGSAVFYDANADKTPDVLLCGRTGILECRNGKDGQLIWEFFSRHKSEAADSGWHNFFQPQIIPDQNKDDIQDILVTSGGDKSKSYNDTTGRPAGLVMVISGKNGRILSRIKTPDGQETYMAPLVHDFNKNGELQVVFGSGGETMTGALWVIDLVDLIGEKQKSAKRLAFIPKKGFIAPPSIGDLNLDGYDDLVVSAYNGDLMAFSGLDFSELWTVDLNGFETQCSPAIGNFYGTHHADVLAVVFKGQAPNFTDYQQLLIDGRNGKIVWRDSLSDLQFASPAAFDYNEDGYDEAVFSYNKRVSGSFVHDLEVFNFQTLKATALVSNEKGINLSSTPLIVDLDGDDSLEVVYAVKKNDQNPIAADGLYIKVLKSVSAKPAWGIAWGGYLSGNGEGKYQFSSSACSRSELNVSVNKKQPSCNNHSDGEIELTLISGKEKVVYNWSDNGTGRKRDKMKAGTYIVRYMDQQGCFQLDTVKLKDPYEVEISADETFCPNEATGAAYISSSGCKCANSGCKYKWSNGGTDHSIYSLEPGIYTIELTHADGCKVYDTVEVRRSHPIIDTLWKRNISCYGFDDGEIFLQPFDSIDFAAKWLHNQDTVWHLDSLEPDTYRVALRDYRWCFDTLEVIVKEPKRLNFLVKDYLNIDCHGEATGQIELSGMGGWKPYRFYRDSLGFSDSTLKNLEAGTYEVFVLDSAQCSTDSQTVTLFQRPKLELQLGSNPQTDPFDENGAAWVVVSGGLAPYRYLWDHKNEIGDTIHNVKANTYEVAVTDSLGCKATGGIEVEIDLSTSVYDGSEDMMLMAYPNPSNGVLTVRAKPNSVLTLIDINGKEVYRKQTSNEIISIDCSGLKKGVYLLQSRHGTEIQKVKVVVD